MGTHDQHLPKRLYSKATNPDDTRNLDDMTKKRIARGNGLRTKDDAKKAKRGDRD
jgi:hypothetical protein